MCSKCASQNISSIVTQTLSQPSGIRCAPKTAVKPRNAQGDYGECLISYQRGLTIRKDPKVFGKVMELLTGYDDACKKGNYMKYIEDLDDTLEDGWRVRTV